MINSSKFLWNKDAGFASDKDLGWDGRSPKSFKVQSDRTGHIVEFNLVEEIPYVNGEWNILEGVDSEYESKDGWRIRVTWHAH